MKTAPKFWWSKSRSFEALLLSPLGWVYGAISGRRMHQTPTYSSALPVICVGNFVVGGTGKTPFSLALAEFLKAAGHKPGFLLRGYGGREKGPVQVDLEKHLSNEVGDEALLLAQLGPTVVSSDRPAGARLLEELDIDVILMDDGFQNPALAKRLSFTLIDTETGFGNGKCIPAGPLRAPLEKQILKTDCLVLVGSSVLQSDVAQLANQFDGSVLNANICALPNPSLENQNLYAFAGIGRPEKFYRSLSDLGYRVVRTKSFPDHHQFTEADLMGLIEEAEQSKLRLVTTSKDHVRLKSLDKLSIQKMSETIEILEVKMQVENEDLLSQIVQKFYL